jgi:hypothetical protein
VPAGALGRIPLVSQSCGEFGHGSQYLSDRFAECPQAFGELSEGDAHRPADLGQCLR